MSVPEEVAAIMREECSYIVRSPDFRRSPVMTRLLEFLVEFCIDHDSAGPKAYTVAVEGLGREPDFDSNVDSYPRVQVGRLRKMITAYYAAHPRSNRIAIPVGHYKVELEQCQSTGELLGLAQPDVLGPKGGNMRRRLGLRREPSFTWALFLTMLGLLIGVLGYDALMVE